MGLTITALADRVQTEADAYKFLEDLRWPSGTPTCPHCGNVGADYIAPTNGTSRATRTGAMSERRVWRCGGCRKQFSVLTGTPLHGTKIAVRKWVFVIFEMCSSKNGVAAREIERKYGLCPRTAWFMMHRIREIMDGERVESLSGTIVADETWIGGNLANTHRGPFRWERIVPGQRTPESHMTTVLTLVNKDTGEARSRVIPNVTGATLHKAIAEQVNMAASVLYTDSHTGYKTLGREFVRHETVNHVIRQYVRYRDGEVITSNAAENFFSQLKRSIDGTHHHVSKVHLSRYLAEFDYRFSHRKMSDTTRMGLLMGGVPMRRLTYKGVVVRAMAP
jgi:transposase-like protein